MHANNGRQIRQYQPVRSVQSNAVPSAAHVTPLDAQVSQLMQEVNQLRERVAYLEQCAMDPVGSSGGYVWLPASQILTLEVGNTSQIIVDATKVEARGVNVKVQSVGDVTVSATRVQVSAATLQVDAATANFSGTVKCQSLTAQTVTANSYTPGAGNIW